MGEIYLCGGRQRGRISEQVWLPRIGLWWIAQFPGAARSFHGEDQDQKGLIEVAVIELGSFAEAFGYEVVSEFQVVENGSFWSHGFKKGCWLADLELSLAQLFPELAQLAQGALTALGLFQGGGGRGSRGFGRGSGWSESDPADVQIFLKAVELEEIG